MLLCKSWLILRFVTVDLSEYTHLFTPHLCSDLFWQQRGDKVRTKFWTPGWLARASGPWSHFGVSRSSTEAAVCPHQGEIVLFSSCQIGVGINEMSWCTLSCFRHEEALPIDLIFWPCSHISQTGPPCCSVSALFSASTETTSSPFYLFMSSLEVSSLDMWHAICFRLDPSSSLDFLWACSHIPRIWQGRDQKIRQVRLKIHTNNHQPFNVSTVR